MSLSVEESVLGVCGWFSESVFFENRVVYQKPEKTIKRVRTIVEISTNLSFFASSKRRNLVRKRMILNYSSLKRTTSPLLPSKSFRLRVNFSIGSSCFTPASFKKSGNVFSLYPIGIIIFGSRATTLACAS